jgi:hypothetical protein
VSAEAESVPPVPPFATGSGAVPARKACKTAAKLPRIKAISERSALSTFEGDMPVLILMPSTLVFDDAELDQSKIEAIRLPFIVR